MEIEERIQPYRNVVDGWLDELLPSPQQSPQILHTAMRYSVLTPGKRIRPILAILAGKMLGSSPESMKYTACAIECIHAFSLIHDDLPAIDNDDLRRGRLTCHKRFDEPTAIMAGDALFAFAYDLLSRSSNASEPSAQLAVIREVSRAVGSMGLVGGEMLDIEAENQDVTKQQLFNIHRGKTAALIECSVVCGAIIAGGDPGEIAAIRTFGSEIGLAFQIADDLLNVIGDAKQLGKAVGSDKERGKATYPSLYGLEGTKQELHIRVSNAKNAISVFGDRADDLSCLADYVADRDK